MIFCILRILANVEQNHLWTNKKYIPPSILHEAYKVPECAYSEIQWDMNGSFFKYYYRRQKTFCSYTKQHWSPNSPGSKFFHFPSIALILLRLLSRSLEILIPSKLKTKLAFTLVLLFFQNNLKNRIQIVYYFLVTR